MQDSNSNYSTIKGKTAEEILATPDCSLNAPIGEYYRVAAQVRTNQELVGALSKASEDSGKVQERIVCLTIVIAAAAVAQVVATAWPYLVWAWDHWRSRQ